MTRHAWTIDLADGTFTPSKRGLPMRRTSVAGLTHRPGWLFVAAHGGTGASLLARMSWQPFEQEARAAAAEHRPFRPNGLRLFGMNAGRRWPNPALEPTRAVVVVCRTTMRGLAWARDLAAQHATGGAPPLDVVGLVAVADQPGRPPRALASARSLLTGAYRHVWDVPHVPDYRLLTGLPDEPCPAVHPSIADVLDSVRVTVSPATKGLVP